MDASFKLHEPHGEAQPMLVEVPHAGLVIPDDIQQQLTVQEDVLRRDADIYVDALYADAPSRGAALLVAQSSRYVVDLNRAADDVDEFAVQDHPSPQKLFPRGVVWRVTTEGEHVLRTPLTYQQLTDRIQRFYEPYHQALTGRIIELRRQHSHVVLLAGHSMPSVGRREHLDAGTRRADVVPGTRGRTTADATLIDVVDAHFRNSGLSVRHDDPYKGGWTTGHYGNPDEGVHAIQVELNRALYVDELTFERREPEFTLLRQCLSELMVKLAEAVSSIK